MVDFGKFFHKTTMERLSFQTRGIGGNYRHDIVFISSYLHDATFSRDDFVLKDGVIDIVVNRACWELYRMHEKTTHLLPASHSRLRISDVWRIKLPHRMPKEFMIGQIYLGPKGFDRDDFCDLVIISQDLKSKVKVRAKQSAIPVSLEDLDDPT